MDAILHHGDKLLVAQKAVPVVVEDLENWKSFFDVVRKIYKLTPKVASANGQVNLCVSYVIGQGNLYVSYGG